MHRPLQENEGRSILLGDEFLTMSAEPVRKVRLNIASLNRHAHITGTTGSGKSTTAKVICAGLAENHVPTVVLDRTGEYAEAFAENKDATILRPGDNLIQALFGFEGGDLPAQLVEWLSLLHHYYWVSYGAGLPPLQGRVLRNALFDHYSGSKETLTIDGLIERLDQTIRENRDVGGWPEAIQAAISRLWPLTVSKVGSTFNRPYSTFRVDQLFEPRLTVIDLSVFPDDNSRNLPSQLVLKQVYEATRKGSMLSGDALRLVCLIDEAHHICPNVRDYISIPEGCAIELRKYGFSLITCATRPALVSPNIIANSNVLISHMLNNQEDIETAAGFFIGVSSIKASLRRLAVGEAMVQVNAPRPLNAVRCRVIAAGIAAGIATQIS